MQIVPVHAPAYNPFTLRATQPDVTGSTRPHDLPGLPPYHLVMATIFRADPEHLSPVARLALEAWNAAVREATRGLLSTDQKRAAGYAAAAKVLGACWQEEAERELVEQARAFVLADDPTPITDGYFVEDEPQPAIGLPAGAMSTQRNRPRSPSEFGGEDYEGQEVRGSLVGHDG